MMADKQLVSTKVDQETNEIAQKILNEDNIDNLKNLTALFNLNQAKKNVIRVLKLSGLHDSVTNNIIERFEKHPGEFSNDELIKYLSVIESSIEKAQKSLGMVETAPTIQFNQQNNVNIVVGDDGVELDRESRQRVMDAINQILASQEQGSPISQNDGEIE